MAMALEKSGDGARSSERTLRWVGDLDHPFYDDERQRFVWYEASAIGLQLFLFANLALVGAMLWIGGAEALPYAIALFVVQGLISIVVIGYAKRNYAEYEPRKSDFTSLRNLLLLGLLAFALTGLVRAQFDRSSGEFSVSFADIAGFAVGVGLVGGVVAILIALNKQKSNEVEELDDL